MNLNSNNTVNFLGMGGSLYNGTLGAHTNSNKSHDTENTPVPSFGRISARDEKSNSSNERSNPSNLKSKALTFSESSKFSHFFY